MRQVTGTLDTVLKCTLHNTHLKFGQISEEEQREEAETLKDLISLLNKVSIVQFRILEIVYLFNGQINVPILKKYLEHSNIYLPTFHIHRILDQYKLRNDENVLRISDSNILSSLQLYRKHCIIFSKLEKEKYGMVTVTQGKIVSSASMYNTYLNYHLRKTITECNELSIKYKSLRNSWKLKETLQGITVENYKIND